MCRRVQTLRNRGGLQARQSVAIGSARSFEGPARRQEVRFGRSRLGWSRARILLSFSHTPRRAWTSSAFGPVKVPARIVGCEASRPRGGGSTLHRLVAYGQCLESHSACQGRSRLSPIAWTWKLGTGGCRIPPPPSVRPARHPRRRSSLLEPDGDVASRARQCSA